MIVSLASQKGGSGKTTTSICLADEWHRRGHDVLLIDADPQGTAITWAAVANENDIDGPDVVTVDDDFHEKFPNAADPYEHVVIDCPPGDADHKRSPHTPRQRSAMFVSDLVVIPTGPGITDIWAVGKTLELVDEAQQYRPELSARIALNRLNSRTILGDKAKNALRQTPVPLLDATLGERVAFQETPATGRGVTRYEPNGKAADEAKALVDEIENL